MKRFTVNLTVNWWIFWGQDIGGKLATTQFSPVFVSKFLKIEMTHFTVNLTINDTFYSQFNCTFMHFTVYTPVKLHRPFNCNFTSIYNSVTEISLHTKISTTDITEISPHMKISTKMEFITLMEKFSWSLKKNLGFLHFSLLHTLI